MQIFTLVPEKRKVFFQIKSFQSWISVTGFQGSVGNSHGIAEESVM